MQRQTIAPSLPFPTLPIHAWLNRIGFPRSYTGKFFLVAFLANALPLLAVGVYVALYPAGLASNITFLLVLVGAVLGGLLASFALGGLLQPIYQANHTLKAYLDGGVVPAIPLSSGAADDEANALTQNLNYALAMFEAHQHQSQRDTPRDFLTGLLNRRAAQERLTHITHTMQAQPFEMCIGLFDLHTLKDINERYGYLVGDQVLWRVARTITYHLRGTDWVARWGGHELLLAIQADAEGTAHAFKRLQQEIEGTILEIGEHAIPITLKVGYTLIRAGEPLEEMAARLERV